MMDDKISLIEWGRMLGRLDSQDIKLKQLEDALIRANDNISTLVALANRGKGVLMMLCLLGGIVSSVIGWVAGHWLGK
jgi:hypothetical protein